MKTSVEISDALYLKAKKVMRQRGLTLRALLEEGLAKVLAEKAQTRPFSLRSASVDGQGLAADFSAADWDLVRREIYAGRGE